MRILHLSSEYPPERVFGLGRYVCDLSRELAKQGHVVHVLTNSMGGMDQDIIDHAVSVHRTHSPPPPKPPGTLAPALAFNTHLQQRAFDLGFDGLGEPEVIVSHDWLTAAAGHQLARRFTVPHVWTVHDTIEGKRFGVLNAPTDRMTSAIERWAAQAADLVLVNSRSIFDEMRTRYQADPTRMRLLHCGVDPDRFRSTQAPARLAGFRRVFARPDEVLVTFTGRLDIEKGLDTLINAFSTARNARPGLRLAIVGHGALEPTIREHIGALHLEGSVTLYGYLSGEALKHVYKVSDVHVCPSHYEPFGIVAVEAMAAGAATVVSETGGLTDIVTDDSVGRRFPARDSSALAKILIELCDDPRLRSAIGRAGTQHVRDHFSWSRIAGEAAALYELAHERTSAHPTPTAP